jgi:hypothetical protein
VRVYLPALGPAAAMAGANNYLAVSSQSADSRLA